MYVSTVAELIYMYSVDANQGRCKLTMKMALLLAQQMKAFSTRLDWLKQHNWRHQHQTRLTETTQLASSAPDSTDWNNRTILSTFNWLKQHNYHQHIRLAETTHTSSAHSTGLHNTTLVRTPTWLKKNTTDVKKSLADRNNTSIAPTKPQPEWYQNHNLKIARIWECSASVDGTHDCDYRKPIGADSTHQTDELSHMLMYMYINNL